MLALLQDLRFALRQIFKNPTYAAVAVLSLAFGIGATTSVFSVIHGCSSTPIHTKTRTAWRMSSSQVRNAAASL